MEGMSKGSPPSGRFSLWWGLFVPPVIVACSFGSIFALERFGFRLGAHGPGAVVAFAGILAEVLILAFNPVLVPWSIWLLATSQTRITIVRVALILLGIVSFFAALLHWSPALRKYALHWFSV